MKYVAQLVNNQGCAFDEGRFDTLRAASDWASGRGPCTLRLYVVKNGERHWHKDIKKRG